MGKKVLITGGGSLIAQHVGRIWAKRGYVIYVIDKDENKARAVVTDLKVRGAKEVWSQGADLSDSTVNVEQWEGVKKTMGEVDILLVAQGYLGEQKKAQEDLVEREKIIATNFTGPVVMLELVAREMEQRGEGVIAAIGSVAGDRGRQSIYGYGAAKGALAIWLAGMRHRLSRKGVTVVTIKPGYVITPMTANEDRAGWLWAKPERVAWDIVRAIDRKKTEIYTPWFWRWVMWAIRMIPDRLFSKLRI
jgi:hypothetical protein